MAALAITGLVALPAPRAAAASGFIWTDVSPTFPPERSSPTVAYDSGRSKTVLFGGYNGSGSEIDDTWEWDGTTWTQRSPSASPPARGDAMMAYDSGRSMTVLFGGYSTGVLGDTWEWDGTTWTQRSPAASPPARSDAAMVYDSVRDKTVLFGGSDHNGSDLGDTWEWDGTTWTPRDPASSPSIRFDPAMAYDPVLEKTVLFGGFHDGFLSDTWEWNGTTWTERAPATSPPARFGAGMAYDSSGEQIVLFGGVATGSSELGDTWTWNDTTWAELSPATSPSPRFGSAMAYDSARDKIVLVGGYEGGAVPDVTWEFDGTTWTQRNPASPTVRSDAAMAYDSARGKTVLFGGSGETTTFLADTWEWDGTAWNEVTPAPSPAARLGAMMAYDSARERIVLFGGNKAGGTFGDTWEWDGTEWTELSPEAPPPPRAGGTMVYDSSREKIVLFGGNGASGYLDDTWEWNGATWTDVTPSTPPSPPPRYLASMAYDSVLEKTVLFGGYGATATLGDTWEWDGTAWTDATPASPDSSPSARSEAAMTYDPGVEKTVMFGGADASGYLGDIWEWDGATWIQGHPASSPSRRSVATMAYDSAREKTVLFGGYNGADPIGDTWELSATTPASKLVISSVNGGSSPVAGSGFDVVVRSADADDSFADVGSATGVQLALKTGNGTLGGTLSGTIPDGGDSVTISGVTYDKAESGVELTAAITSGDSLSSADSGTFSVVAGAAARYLVTSSNSSPIAGEPVDVEAQLTDANGNPVASLGRTVTWTVNPAKGSFDSPTSQTDAKGVAKQRYMSWVVKDKYNVTARDAANLEGTVEISTAASLVKNWAFEIDKTPKDGRPDSWTSNANFIRQTAVKFSGAFAGRHKSTANATYTIQQTVLGLSPGKTYDFSGWVRLSSPTNDDFTFSIVIRWRNNSNAQIGPAVLVKKYSKASPAGTWDQATASLTAPAGATRAQIQMVVKKLNATIYVDQFSLAKRPA